MKIFREVNALSRLSHRFIVRYFTTWVETSDEPNSTAASDDSEAESGTEDGMTSVPDSSERYLPTNGGVNIDFKEMDELERKSSYSQSSFPSIHFGRSTSPGTETEGDSSSGSDEGFGDLFIHNSGKLDRSLEPPSTPPPMMSRTLYIQMVFHYSLFPDNV